MGATRKWMGAIAIAQLLIAQAAGAAGPVAYVAAYEANAVSVIETSTHTVIATVPVCAGPFGVAATPDGRLVYVTCNGGNSVAVIDTKTNTVVATVPVGISPFGVAVTPDGRSAYASMGGDGSLYVINTATNSVASSSALGLAAPIAIAFSPDGAFAYTANAADDTVSVLNAVTNTVAASVPAGPFPFDIAVSPDGRFAYVVNMASADAVSIIDTAANQVVASIALEEGSQGIAIHPDGRFAYVTHGLSGTVSVVDTATNARVGTIQVGLNPIRVAVSPDGRVVYVTNQDSSNVSVIDTASNAVVATVPVGSIPQGVAFASAPPDKLAPATAAAATPVANAAGWYTGPVTVTLGATDNKDGSGVKSITYTVNGAATTVAGAAASFLVSAQGVNTVTYQATDNAGNVEPARNLGLFIDSLVPTSTASATPPAGSGGSNTGPVTVSVTAADSGSGVQSINILRTNGSSTVGESFPGASASVVVSAAGVTTVAYQAIDTAGNAEPARTLTIRIEAAPAPALSAKLSAFPPVLWPPDRRFDTIATKLKVANAVGRVTVKSIVVTSDEPVTGYRDHTAPDWIVHGRTVKLRAERSEYGNGRVYTITYTIVDEAGNTAQAADTVTVPKHLSWHHQQAGYGR